MGHLPFDPSKLSPPDLALYNGMVERRKAQGAGFGGPYSALMNHPKLCAKIEDLGFYLKFQGHLPRNIYQFVVLSVARSTGATFEWIDHAKHAEAVGVPASVITTLQGLWTTPQFPIVSQGLRCSGRSPGEHQSEPQMFILDDGCMTLNARYLKLNRLGIYQFHRRIPEDLQGHYDGRSHIQQSLKTRDPMVAAKAAGALARSQDALWKTLRSPQGRELALVPPETRTAAMSLLEHLGYERGARRKPNYDSDAIDEYLEARKPPEYLEARYDGDPMEFLDGVERETVRLLNEDPTKPQRLLSDCLARYLADHENGAQPVFVQSTSRNVNVVVDVIGDLPLEAITRDHARAVLEALVSSGKATGTIHRQLTTIKAVINHCIHEWHLVSLKNPFEHLKIKGFGKDIKPRHPFTHDELVTIAAACRELDTNATERRPDLAWIIGLQMDLGTRIEEVVGLRVEDIKLDAPVPFVHLRPHHAIGRHLKTQGSERTLPLVGEALHAAQRALRHPSSSGWLFPRYASDGRIMTNSASKLINQKLRKLTGTDKGTHSFRHSMKDRLRDVDVSEQMQRQIMGHSGGGVAAGYGKGFSLGKLKEALDKVVLASRPLAATSA